MFLNNVIFLRKGFLMCHLEENYKLILLSFGKIIECTYPMNVLDQNIGLLILIHNTTTNESLVFYTQLL